MTPKMLRYLLPAVLILGLLGLALSKSRMVDPDEHYSYLATLSQLQELEVALNEIILRSRHAYLTNYDPLVEILYRLRDNLEALHELPRFINRAERATFYPLLEKYRNLQQQREELSERFKSNNAILHNSLSFFPIAASEMSDILVLQNPRLATELQELLRDTFMYNLYSHIDILKRLKERVLVLKETPEHLHQIDPAAWKRNLRHAEVIITYKVQLDQITLENLNLPTRAALLALHYNYQNAYQRAMTSANNYRLLLYMTSILLAAGLSYTTLHRYNVGQALRQTNEFLETKVRQRTAELQQSNLILEDQKARLNSSLAELKKTQIELERLAMTDELTGLYARRYIFEFLKTHLASIVRKQSALSCLMLDVDHFKQINDQYGHIQGDTVLRKIASCIRDNIRKTDVAGRFGGEEFIVLLPDAPATKAIAVAEKIRQAVAEITEPIAVTISIGISDCDCRQERTTESIEELNEKLIQSADIALYRAKEQGRNQICVDQ